MLLKEPVVRSAPKANTASKINELVHNLRSKEPSKNLQVKAKPEA